MNSIAHEINRPAKTFATNTYLFLGITLSGIGIYYFITQSNWERPEEYFSLGVGLFIGLFFLAGYQSKWALPNSKPFYHKIEYFINSETNELLCMDTLNNNPTKTTVLCSLKGVESFDFKVENKTTTSKVGDFEDSYGTGLGHTMPTGLNYRSRNVTSTRTTNYIILLPMYEKIIVSSSITNMSNFSMELNGLLKKQITK